MSASQIFFSQPNIFLAQLPVITVLFRIRFSEDDQYNTTHSDYVDDILQYWNNQLSSNNVPILCQLAELYLGMASSSVPVECLFSSVALTAHGKCSSLKPYKLKQILFVHVNFDLARDSLLNANSWTWPGLDKYLS